MKISSLFTLSLVALVGATPSKSELFRLFKSNKGSLSTDLPKAYKEADANHVPVIGIVS